MQEAVNDYINAEKISPLDNSEMFNKNISEGILLIQSGKHDKALEKISKAIDLFPSSKEGYIYRFLTYISCKLVENELK